MTVAANNIPPGTIDYSLITARAGAPYLNKLFLSPPFPRPRATPSSHIKTITIPVPYSLKSMPSGLQLR